MIVCAMVLLALPESSVPGKPLPSFVAVLAVGKDLVVVIGFVLIYFTVGRVLVHPRPIGKLCTFFQLLTGLCVLCWPVMPAWLGRLPDILWWSASGLAILSAADYVRSGFRFVAAVHEEDLAARGDRNSNTSKHLWDRGPCRSGSGSGGIR